MRKYLITALLYLSLLSIVNGSSAQNIGDINFAQSTFEQLLEAGDKFFVTGINTNNLNDIDEGNRIYRMAIRKAVNDEQIALTSDRYIKNALHEGNRLITKFDDYVYAQVFYSRAILHAAYPNLRYTSNPAFRSESYIKLRDTVYDCIRHQGLDPAQFETHYKRAKEYEALGYSDSLYNYILALELKPDDLEVQGKVKTLIESQSRIFKQGVHPLGKREIQFQKVLDHHYNNRVLKYVDPPNVSYPLLGTVSYSVDENGRLLKVLIRKSSNNAKFDESLVKAVQYAAPFPALPNIRKYLPPSMKHFYVVQAFKYSRD